MAAIESIANLKLNDTVPQCPFADPENPSPYESSVIRCPFHKIKHILPEDPSRISQAVPVRISNGTFTKSGSSAQLLRDIGGGKRIREMTTRFYAHAFKDYTLDPFMFMGDGAERHGQRLGDWIIEKMGGEGEPWTNSGRKGMRQPTHAQAWHSKKRSPSLQGQRFQLDDTRIWMRLIFWSAREIGLADHKPFWNWFVGFIKHFIAVYEGSAPPYAQESAEWSESVANVKKYIEDGHKMVDVIGYGRRR